jgi:hypothetical protein
MFRFTALIGPAAILAAVVVLTGPLQAVEVVFEAESFTSEGGLGFFTLGDALASNGLVISTQGDVTGPPDATVYFDLTFDTVGSYYLYGRLYAPNPPGGFDDSMYVGPDFGTYAPLDASYVKINNLDVVTPAAYVWHNLSRERPVPDPPVNWNTRTQIGAAPIYSVTSPGSKTFSIGGREDGLVMDAFVFSTRSSLTEQDLDTLLDGGVIDSPEPLNYLNVALDYADALVDHGTDTYGSTQSGMILSMMNRHTLQPFSSMPTVPNGVRPADRVTTHGSNVNLDQNMYRVLYMLSDMTGDSKYSTAADAALSKFLQVSPSPATGLLAWGEHLCWDLQTDAAADMNSDKLIHEPKRPTVLFDKLYELNPTAMINYADGLWDHQIANHTDGNFSRHARYGYHAPGTNYDFPKEGGYFINDWARAHGKTGESRFLGYIDVLADRYTGKLDDTVNNLIAFDSIRGFADTSASISLAVDSYRAAQELAPGPVRDKLMTLAARIDQGLQALPHAIGDPVLGFVQYVTVEDDYELYFHKDNGGYSFTWNMKYGNKTTAMLGTLFHTRYTQLVAEEGFLMGDFNDDGSVGNDDLLAWQRGFGIETGATWADGDANRDGDVDGDDFLIWQANFGTSTPLTAKHKYREMTLEAADLYLTSDPNVADRPWPVELGIVASLELAAFELTGDQDYFERAKHFTDLGYSFYWDEDSPLPKADPLVDHYENITRADTLVYAMLQIKEIEDAMNLGGDISDIDRVADVPEPSTLALLLAGVFGSLLLRKR